MRYWIAIITVLVVCYFGGPKMLKYLPPEYNPFTPLAITDPPNLITRYKLRELDNNPEACIAILEKAQKSGAIQFNRAENMGGKCPLYSPVRVNGFGDVALSSSYLASCRLALSSAMFITQIAKPQAEKILGSALTRVDHLGSYACRNVYNRPGAKLSEHATAEALDLAGFRVADGRRLTVLKQWPQTGAEGVYIHTLFSAGCPYFGNAIGPDYNAAHANHFHLGMRWFGFCR